MIFIDRDANLWLYDDGTLYDGNTRIVPHNYSLSRFVHFWQFEHVGWL